MTKSTPGLRQLKPGVFIHDSDSQYELKAMRYRAYTPSSPIHEAKLLVRAGQYKQAKALYLSLLRHKENFALHRQLAPLLTYDETLAMIDKYWDYKKLRHFYQERAKTYPISGQRQSRTRWLPWLLVGLALVSLPLLYGLHRYLHRVTTTNIEETYQNTIQHIAQLPTFQFAGTIHVPTEDSDAIVHTVDTASMTPEAAYELLDNSVPVGYAVNHGNNQFSIYLLQNTTNTSSGQPVNDVVSQPGISATQLNTVRTAYQYYLATHANQPPAKLTALEGMVPSSIDLSTIPYVPVTDPSTAITNGTSQPVPFVKPVVYINLQKRTLSLQLNGKTVLHTPVGIGNTNNPTPTGDFTVSERKVNHTAGVYGQYIFPLNESSYALHGTDDEHRIGSADSLGCIEIPSAALQKLYDTIPVGTQVLIQNGDTPAPPTSFRA
ncbi:hypothetical protein AAC03nite_35680 [Alicyclobacillus acidoterrestris]|nr:hypothetical protein AAC03nite_35680 [Alicyclobacillus acidoterrestris]